MVFCECTFVFIRPIGQVVIEEVEIVLLLLRPRGDGHIVAIKGGKIAVGLCYTLQGDTLEGDGLRCTIHLRGHDAAHAEVVVYYPFGLRLAVFALQSLQMFHYTR